MLKRGLLVGLAAALVLAIAVPSRAALTVRAVVRLGDGRVVVLNTPTLQFTPSPGAALKKATVVCIKRVDFTAGAFWITSVHAVKGSKHYYFAMNSVGPKFSPVHGVIAADFGTTPYHFPGLNPCDAPYNGTLGVGVAVFG